MYLQNSNSVSPPDVRQEDGYTETEAERHKEEWTTT